MLETDKAYAAGFLDGEGSIWCGRLRGEIGVGVRIGQKDRRPLDWLVLLFGGNVRTDSQRRGLKPGWPIYRWEINGKLAVRFLEAVCPYLIVKQAEAQEAIDRFTEQM